MSRTFHTTPRLRITPSPPQTPPTQPSIAAVPTATTSVPVGDPTKLAAAPPPSSGAQSISPASSEIPTPPPPPPPKKPRNRLRTFARSVLVLIVGTTTFVVWDMNNKRHPGAQLPFDEKLPTVVVVGNGWGSTAFLKHLQATDGYNIVVISPRNYFLFTPLLPSVTVGTLAARSILEPTRFLTRHHKREVKVYEGEVTNVNPETKTLTFVDNSPIKGAVAETDLSYDYLVYAIGAENQTFGISGVSDHACFLKEISDAEKIRGKLMDCIESANFKGQSQEEIDRLLSFVVVGGGPTGVEYAGELHDFVQQDLANWYPDLADRIKITLIEALPNVLPMFSKQLIDFTMSTFAENKINIATKTMVKEVREKVIVAQNEKKELVEYPYGLLVWATGNKPRNLTRKLMEQLKEQDSRRGLLVDEHLRVRGAEGIFALGDCTATEYAPTAQAASQQGKYLARVFHQLAKKEQLLRELEAAKASHSDPAHLDSLANAVIRASAIRPFHYTHQGSLAYIGSDKAIADLPALQGNIAAAGMATYWFWRSAYMSQLFSLRNRILVATDWLKTKVLGRDVSRE